MNEDEQWNAMFRSHLERCLQDIWEQFELICDGDGDYAYRVDTAACWVGPTAGEPASIRVFGHAAHGLKSSAKLLAELNEINAGARWVRVYLERGILTVDAELHWTAVTRESLERTMRAVASAAVDIGPLAAGVFGGITPFAPESSEPSHGEVA